MNSQSFCSPFCHRSLHIHLQKQVLNSDFPLVYMMHFHDMADVGTRKTIQLLHLFGGIIVVIAHLVGSAKFFKMFLGIIGATILTLGRYLVAIGVCPKCCLAHRKGSLHLIGSHPFRGAVEVNGCAEEFVNMAFAVCKGCSQTFSLCQPF